MVEYVKQHSMSLSVLKHLANQMNVGDNMFMYG